MGKNKHKSTHACKLAYYTTCKDTRNEHIIALFCSRATLTKMNWTHEEYVSTSYKTKWGFNTAANLDVQMQTEMTASQIQKVFKYLPQFAAQNIPIYFLENFGWTFSEFSSQQFNPSTQNSHPTFPKYSLLIINESHMELRILCAKVKEGSTFWICVPRVQ